MKYFLTGASGFIGGRVARQLVDAGHQVVAFVRDPQRAAELSRLGASIAPGDIVDKESLRTPMEGADGVFHIAAWYKIGAKDKSAARSINVQGTRNVLEVMKELQIPKGVYTSSLAVFSDTKDRLVDESYRYDGPHLSEYDRTKWLAHYEVALPMMADGLPLVIVQPGVVYGPGDTSAVGKTLKQYLEGKLPLIPKQTAYCWAHVDDVARGHILAMEKGQPGQSYIIAGPRHTLIEAFELAERVTGVKAPPMRAGPGFLKFMSKLTGILGRFVPLPENYNEETLRVAAGVTYLASNAKAKRELGYEVRPLEEGLTETLQQLRKEISPSDPRTST